MSKRLQGAAPPPVRSSRSSWLIWAGVAALALFMRLSHVWAIHGTPLFDHLVGNSQAYDAWAQRIAAGNWLGTGVFYQAPLYPYFLAAVYTCAGHSLLVRRLVQAVLGGDAATIRRCAPPASLVYRCPQ